METVESQRVLSVIDDVVDGLRLLSYITPEVILAADQLGGVLGQDVQDALQQHAAALQQLPSDFPPHELLTTASNLLRTLKKADVEVALASLHSSRSPAMLQLLSYAERHRALVIKRLHTTVEEDTSIKARLAELSARLEAAGSERLQLEHKLKLQRLEQAKAMGNLQTAYDAAAAVLADLRACAAARQAADEATAAADKQQSDGDFHTQHSHLTQQLQARRKQLDAARSEGAESLTSALKTRRRALQDCEAVIGEYDAEMSARQAEYDAVLAAHNELLANIQRVTSETAALRTQRLAYEEAQRAAAEAAKRAELARFRREAAVYLIQNRWKVYKKTKAAAAKAAAKGGKGGKGAKGDAAASSGAKKKKK